MAQNDIQRAGLNDIIRRSLTIKGDVPPSPVVGAEIIPAIILENDRFEFSFLGGERRGQQHLDLTAVAAQRSKFVFTNPLQTNLQVVVESITVEPGTVGGTMELWVAGPDVSLATIFGGAPTGPFNGLATDLRWYRRDSFGNIGFPLMRCEAYFLVSVPPLAGMTFVTDINVPALNFGDLCDRTGPWLLPPGWKFGIEPNVNNQGFCVNLVFRERAYEPGEGGVNMLL